MLRTTIEHFYGSQEKHNIELVKIQLDTKNLDEKEALDNGWLRYEDKWYLCRSTRLKIQDYVGDTLPSSFSVSYTNEANDTLKGIYLDYLAVRGFNDILEYFKDTKRNSYLILSDDNIPVAFTKFEHYNQGLESQLTCWNYHKPKLSIGKKIITYEIEYAKSMGLDYLYIGEGYEASSIYKADLKGFEWWTGTEWSSDKDKYKQFCIRDSNVKTIYDLSDVFSNA